MKHGLTRSSSTGIRRAGMVALIGLLILSCNLPGLVGKIQQNPTSSPTLTEDISTATQFPTTAPYKSPIPSATPTETPTPSPVLPSLTPTRTSPPPTWTAQPGMLTSGQDSWRLSSIDYPAHISIFGKVFYPPKNKIPLLSWQFIRLNFECTTGKSLLTLYTGKDMGLTFINHQSGYGDVYLEDYQGAYYPATLIGACWLAVPAPINVVEENRFALHFQELQPLDIGFQNPGRLEDYRLAYASNLVEDVEIYTLNPINGLSRRLTYLLGKDYEPAWSPDRLQIAFAGQHGGLADLFTIPAAGGEAVNLTQSPNIEEGGPVFSPDGKALAFHARSSGAWNIYRLELAPQALTRLSQDAGDNQYPCWSPDGSQLAFQSNRNGDWDLSIMNKDGSQATTITGDPANEILPSWSPDGTKIAFWSDRGGQWRLYTIDPAGGDWLSLTYYDNPGPSPSRAAWSPDGLYLAVAFYRLDRRAIFQINAADGSNPRRLTEGVADEFDPGW